MKALILLLASWPLVVPPAACPLGFLPSGCACKVGGDCRQDEDCCSEPRGKRSVPPVPSPGAEVMGSLALIHDDPVRSSILTEPAREAAITAASPPARALPYPPSDRPLRL